MPHILIALLIWTLHFWYPTTHKAHAESTVWQEIALPGNKSIKDIELTPWGILIGESAPDITGDLYNGIYLSSDFGQTWEELGLEKSGVQDIKYYDSKIYVATYYANDIGENTKLFVSNDKGQTWNKFLAPYGTGHKIERDSESIYYGTYTYGLWLSQDEGATWTNLGIYADVLDIESSEELTLFSTNNKTYKTTDNGKTWTNVLELEGRESSHIKINDNEVYVSFKNTQGLKHSKDLGETWDDIEFFKDRYVGAIEIIGDKVFVSAKVEPKGTHTTVWVFEDNGDTWIDTGLSYWGKNLNTIKAVPDYPSRIFATSTNASLYSHKVKNTYDKTTPFLQIPWLYNSKNELLTKISAFFDHRYPLLGYSLIKEPLEFAKTTLNFLGEELPIPSSYYSSHNGIDFALDYGAEVLAADRGEAFYYYCKDCGHSIRVLHENGYITTYMHLQHGGLVNYSKTDPIPVEKGQKIGFVGMTGKTTGPHLHFAVAKNLLFPWGLVDPFGWKSEKLKDPWKYFNAKNFSGSPSSYIWEDQIGDVVKPTDETLESEMDHITIKYDNPTKDVLISQLSYYAIPNPNTYSRIYNYLSNSSFLINMINGTGAEIKDLVNDMVIEITLDTFEIPEHLKDTLSIFRYDPLLNTWIKLETIFDKTTNKIRALTNHLSWFAVFTEEQRATPITSLSIVDGSIELSANIPSTTFYSSDGTENMTEYTVPIPLIQGVNRILYRSMSTDQKLEETNEVIIIFNPENKYRDQSKVVRITFEVPTE